MSKKTPITTAGANAADVRAIHNRLKEIIREEIEQLPALLEQLPPAERAKTLLELLQYCAPIWYTSARPLSNPLPLWKWKQLRTYCNYQLPTLNVWEC